MGNFEQTMAQTEEDMKKEEELIEVLLEHIRSEALEEFGPGAYTPSGGAS